jgi:hypothetical protein
VEPTRLDDSLVRQVDGTAGEGDRSRDARYNSAVKYLASAEDTPTVILLVSEDGMINLLPADLRPQDASSGSRRHARRPEGSGGHRPCPSRAVLQGIRRIEAAAFYLSPDQIDEVNACTPTIGSAGGARARLSG